MGGGKSDSVCLSSLFRSPARRHLHHWPICVVLVQYNETITLNSSIYFFSYTSEIHSFFVSSHSCKEPYGGNSYFFFTVKDGYFQLKSEWSSFHFHLKRVTQIGFHSEKSETDPQLGQESELSTLFCMSPVCQLMGPIVIFPPEKVNIPPPSLLWLYFLALPFSS